MKFITVIDLDKINEIIEKGILENNYTFDVEEGAKKILSNVLSSLILESDSLVNGYCLDGRSGDLSSLWSQYLKTLPVKSGDVIVQFKVESDECIFCDFNNFMEFNYLGDFDSIKDIISYRFDEEKIAFTQTLDLVNFEKAFIVSDEWSKNDLVDSSISNGNSSSLITNFKDLKDLSNSCIWR